MKKIISFCLAVLLLSCTMVPALAEKESDGRIIRVLCEINDVGIPGEDYPGLEGMQHTGLIVRTAGSGASKRA